MGFEEIIIDDKTRLIQLVPNQADELFRLTDENREHLGKFLPWPPFVKTVDYSRKHIEETIESRSQNITYTYGIELDGKIVGDISIRNIQGSEKVPEIGYWMSLDYAGKGLTTRSVNVLTEFGLNTLGLKKIIIRANPANIASNRVAEKAGYVQIGTESENGQQLNVWMIEK